VNGLASTWRSGTPRIRPTPASGFQSAFHGLDLVGGGFDDAVRVDASSDAASGFPPVFPSVGSLEHENHATVAESGFKVTRDALAKPVGTEGLRLVLVGRAEVQRDSETTGRSRHGARLARELEADACVFP
jgi:hypothetical protein